MTQKDQVLLFILTDTSQYSYSTGNMVLQAPERILKMWIGFEIATLSHYVCVDTALCDSARCHLSLCSFSINSPVRTERTEWRPKYRAEEGTKYKGDAGSN